MRELKSKCAAKSFLSISFGLFFWPQGATTTNVEWPLREYREREKKEGDGTLAACLHFRFFTPRIGFGSDSDSGSGSGCGSGAVWSTVQSSRRQCRQLPNLSMYLALDTWPGRQRRREREATTHSFHLSMLGVYLMPTVLACCPHQIWHWLFKLSDREFVVTC